MFLEVIVVSMSFCFQFDSPIVYPESLDLSSTKRDKMGLVGQITTGANI